MEKEKMACPPCGWEPDGGPHWQCTCKFSWDTFATHGKCPNCGKVWKDTQCPVCEEWSLHIDWYKGLDGIVKIELEKIIKKIEA